MELKDVIKKFADAFNETEGNLGVVQYRDPVPINEPLPLGDVLREYFASLLLNRDSAIGNGLFLMFVTLDDLIGALNGWRWVTNKTGQVTENPNWNSSWVIIADKNGDVIFVDTKSNNGNVYGSIQQRNFLIANELSDFLITIAECMVVEKERFGYEIKDDDFNVIKPFLDEVRSIAARNLGIEGCKGFMKFFFE